MPVMVASHSRFIYAQAHVDAAAVVALDHDHSIEVAVEVLVIEAAQGAEILHLHYREDVRRALEDCEGGVVPLDKRCGRRIDAAEPVEPGDAYGDELLFVGGGGVVGEQIAIKEVFEVERGQAQFH